MAKIRCLNLKHLLEPCTLLPGASQLTDSPIPQRGGGPATAANKDGLDGALGTAGSYGSTRPHLFWWWHSRRVFTSAGAGSRPNSCRRPLRQPAGSGGHPGPGAHLAHENARGAPHVAHPSADDAPPALDVANTESSRLTFADLQSGHSRSRSASEIRRICS